ncbi:hypothetical protein SELMODRAFT_413610 [Selaginella moellendorffii]|uniref:N-alpha-acetyltransferase 60 n=1 Tax=Selaginella moellendorffii TaxID=88036 RepID=D8RQU5_SELML|nr:hypothetical protein SELMODRAFT_413610 [Selaginella moellendorffii]
MESARSNVGVQHRAFVPQKDQNFSLGAATGIPVLLGRAAHFPNIAYRCVQPSDLEILQEIHEALFPIKYELEFFMSVVHGRGVVAWAAVDTGRSDGRGEQLVGFITARMIKASEAEGEDILGYDVLKADRNLLYILTLGVVKPYRNFGIASALVWQVIEYARRISSCRAVYLHVIAYNRAAINFYQKNTFRCLRRLSKFYHINGHHYDAYLYIYYVNGGRPPCSALYPFFSPRFLSDLLVLDSLHSRFSAILQRQQGVF